MNKKDIDTINRVILGLVNQKCELETYIKMTGNNGYIEDAIQHLEMSIDDLYESLE